MLGQRKLMQKLSNIRDADIESQRIARVALKVFFNIMHEWKVPEAQQIQLLGRPRSKTFKNWQSSSFLSLSPDTLTRISYIVYRISYIVYRISYIVHHHNL